MKIKSHRTLILFYEYFEYLAHLKDFVARRLGKKIKFLILFELCAVVIKSRAQGAPKDLIILRNMHEI
jgi:hypothetical protein